MNNYNKMEKYKGDCEFKCPQCRDTLKDVRWDKGQENWLSFCPECHDLWKWNKNYGNIL